MSINIPELCKDAYINIALDTIRLGKQALIFTNSKPGAEKSAEEISKKNKNNELSELSEQILKTLPKPTKQCERLAKCVKHGIAFHHSGLHPKQKEIIENAFRDGTIKIIACTPTLAAGLDMPAFRTILREVKRYTNTGYNWIQTLEYYQMAGRAGRPGKEDYGESILIANDKKHSEELLNRFIYGSPEDIFSKLAVEPVLRTYILSLISSGFVNSKKEIIDFFSKTFWAFQFRDLDKLIFIIEKMLRLLIDFKFIETSNTNNFSSIDEINTKLYMATALGKRVAELYIDPLTANHILNCLSRNDNPSPLGLLQMTSHTLEMMPLLKVKMKEFDSYQNEIIRYTEELLEPEPTIYDYEYDEFLNSLKTALFFNDWIEENHEDYLLEKYNITPGAVHTKLTILDWLLYTSAEIANMANLKSSIKHINKVRFRIKHGIKEELIPLCRLNNISKIRARKLYNNGIKDLGDIKKANFQTLIQILGEKIALNIKSQVGQKIEPEVKPTKRIGQMGLTKY